MKGEAPSVGSKAFVGIGENAMVCLPRHSGYDVDGNDKWQGMTVEWYGPECTIDENGVLTGVDLHGATEIVIPDGVTSIGSGAFDGCSALTSVTMKGDAPSVGNQAFDGIGENAVVRLPVGASGYDVDDEGKWQGMTVEWYSSKHEPKFIINGNGVLTGVDLHDATEIVIPDSVTSIGPLVFENCSALTSVTIPGSVTSIGEQAFNELNRLQCLERKRTVL